MGKVTYIEFNGTPHVIEVGDGQSLMEGATTHLVPGILADCGGACACATCHVYIERPWIDRVGTADEMEAGMLDMVLHRTEASRLSCQVRMRAELDGLVVRLPESQT
jgi:ferredoxin, 2Fe-2S